MEDRTFEFKGENGGTYCQHFFPQRRHPMKMKLVIAGWLVLLSVGFHTVLGW